MKILFRGALGVAFGGVLLWIAFHQFDWREAASAVAKANPWLMLCSAGIYWVNLAVRIVRWQRLLPGSKQLRYAQVSQVLIVGYAVNNVLPARLGELFRADYLRRLFGVRRSAALGSIILERLLDGVTVVTLFGIGAATAASKDGNSILLIIAATSAAGVGVIVLGVLCITFWHDRLPFHHAPWLAARIAIMAGAFAVLRGRLVVECLFLTAIIWTLEGFAVYLLTAAFGIHLAFLALCLVMGAAALSTMFPSAPGYVGSMQIAFAVTFSALALPSGLGVLLATATQILLLGPVTICGLAILLINQLYSGLKMVRARTSRGSVEAGS